MSPRLNPFGAMKFLACATLALSLLLATMPLRASISVELQFGSFDAPPGSLGVLVADTGGNGFEPPAAVPGVTLSPGSTLGSDDVIIAVFSNSTLPEWASRRGFADLVAELDYEALGVEEGQALQLYVFPERAPGEPVRTGEPHVAYRSEDPSQFTPNSTMGFVLPADGGAYVLALIGPELGGTADLAMVDIAPAPVVDGSGQFTGTLGETERHTYYFEASPGAFLSLSGNGGAGLRAALYHRDGQLIAVSDGSGPFFFEQTLEGGFHTLVLSREDGGSGPLSYQVRFDPDYIRFVQPDVAVGKNLGSMVGAGLFYSPGPTVTLTSKRAKRVKGYASVANLGERPERLAVRAGRGNRFIKVRYRGAGGNVTGALVAGSYRSPVLFDGAKADTFQATFIPKKKKLKKLRKDGTQRYLRKRLVSLIVGQSTSNRALYDGAYLRARTR